mmetsp:Transcript_26138/g.23135  ORF Transcript_26138/g.23135 Transcript_26138/m.23135 type:complete len:91 (+) Transcript_26138:189-461(+)
MNNFQDIEESKRPNENLLEKDHQHQPSSSYKNSKSSYIKLNSMDKNGISNQINRTKTDLKRTKYVSKNINKLKLRKKLNFGDGTSSLSSL